jgi:tripeptide aminopeptidase
MRAYERLMRYARFDTPSTGSSDTCPSTPEQLVLAAALAEEMREMGLSDVRQDEHGYVYGRIPTNIPDCTAPAIGFIAHMDVANDVPCTGVQPQVLHYDGSDLLLSEETGAVLSEAEFPVLADYRGCDLETTDGRTLLGADNKAGIAEILTACERLLAPDAPPHGDVCIGFTPDEEIGRGADLFDVPGFGAPYAYTVDGGAFGQVEYETFNAARSEGR